MPKREDCTMLPYSAISDLVDGALPPLAAWRVRRHVRQCASCAAELVAERRLQSAARALYGDAVPAAFVALPVVSPAPNRRAGVIAAFALAGVTLFGSLLFSLTLIARPGAAFAQVVQAMGAISTVRYTVKNSVYDALKRQTIYYGGDDAVRWEPPAIRNDTGPDEYRVETPQGVLRVRKAGHPLRVVYQVTLPHEDEYKADGNPETRIRRILREELLTPHIPPEGAKKGPVHWVESREAVKGRLLLRFQIGMGAGKTERGERLTRPGYREVLWADPDTHRLVRVLREYYDGKSHWVMDWTNFRYNESLPDALFSLTPPKNAVPMP